MQKAFAITENIILAGFVGTGKSTVGPRLAAHLNRPFVDMDDELIAHFGKSIADAFVSEGEEKFRQVEADLSLRLAQQKGLVIGTSGGAVVNPQSRAALAESGLLICLTASPDEIARRVAAQGYRPLFGADPAAVPQRIREMLEQRRHAYSAIQHQLRTTGLTPDQVLQRVLNLLDAHQELKNMNRIPVQGPSGSYDICIGEGLLSQSGTLLKNRHLRLGPATLVSNQMIADGHAEGVCHSLREAGYEPSLCIVPEGEIHKTLATIATMYDHFMANGLDRKSPIISLGGGVIGDMTGFAAATYLRGAPFVQIPTSLLAMVDASVGGKTGVDMPQGKNLVGAFKQPELVIIDTEVLSTLPGSQFRAGLAEVIKHGIIADPALFEAIEGGGPESLTKLVTDAVQVKVDVVQEDPFEEGRRAVLNLGHTFGHAIEWTSELTLGHGEAVAIGMVAAAHLSASMGRCSPELVGRIIGILEKVELPTSVSGYTVDDVMAAMWFDKKRQGKNIRFIIPQAIGDVVIIDNPGDDLVRAAVEKVVL